MCESFRLDKEPWIPVVYRDGTQKEVGLVQVFRDAESIRELTGTPPEAAVLFRLLLAIAYSVRIPQSTSEWAEIWEGRSDFMQECAAFVEAHPEWWNLFDDVHPFGQDASLMNATHSAHLLRYDCSRDNAPLVLDHHAAGGSHVQRPSVMARGILCTHAYGGSSGGGYTMGPLAVRVIGMVTTSDMAGTLVLNLLTKAKQGGFDFGSWSSGERKTETPRDVRGWLLRGARRLRAFENESGTGVSQVAIRPGDSLDGDSIDRDPMVLLKADKTGGKYVAFQVEESKALWRSAAILLAVKGDGRPLLALQRVGQLINDGEIDGDVSLSLRVIGLNGSAQGPTTKLWRDDILSFGLDVIADDERFTTLERMIGNAEEVSSTLRKRIWRFCSSYLTNGSGVAPDKESVRKLVDEIAPDLSDYWSEVGPHGERLVAEPIPYEEWDGILKKASKNAYKRAVERLYPDARRLRAQFA